MKKIIFLILIIFFGLVCNQGFVLAEENSTEINFFYSITCPHCHEEMEFLKTIEYKYPEIRINQYEIINNKENQEKLKNFYEEYNVPVIEQGYVPVTFTPDKYFVGFSEQTAKDIETCLKDCLLKEDTQVTQMIKIPILGNVDLSKMSLPVLTLTMGALDGFNPCAMWVLIFLISLLINVRSKKRMYLIMGTFILASGIIYYLILAAWLKLFLVISYVNLTRILIGVFALILGIWQIKNFINYQPGVCKVTDNKQGFQEKIKSEFKNHTKKLVSSPLNIGIIGGIILLALGVNLIEFFCSAGLPAIYTRILSLNNLSSISYHFYLLLYTFVFMLDDLIIFSIAIFALTKFGFTEKYNYWATLIGGLLIFILGLLLIFKPEILMFT